MRKNTSSTLSGFVALFAVEPSVPTWSRADEVVGPASKIMPEMLTPGTSATFIVTLPLVGITVGNPSPMIFVLGLVTSIVWSYWYTPGVNSRLSPAASAALICSTVLEESTT